MSQSNSPSTFTFGLYFWSFNSFPLFPTLICTLFTLLTQLDDLYRTTAQSIMALLKEQDRIERETFEKYHEKVSCIDLLDLTFLSNLLDKFC